MQQVISLLKRFRKDERGVFMVVFAILAIVLIATSGAIVDFTRIQQARTQAQTALDGAALALQAQINRQSNDQLKASAQQILSERLSSMSVTGSVTGAEKNVPEGRLTLNAYVQIPTAFVQLVGIPSIRANLQSEVRRASSDLEVALSLDVTGSMSDRTSSGTRMSEMIAAANELIDLIVQNEQEPTYSRMGIVPWSYAVNVGNRADRVRGTPTPGVAISAVTYKAGVSKNITGITRASPGVITIANNTSPVLANNDWVYISGVTGMTQINGSVGQITDLSTSGTSRTFKLKVNGSNLCTSSGCGFSTYSKNGTVEKCLYANCVERVTTTGNHGLQTGDWAYITGVNGMSNFSNNAWQITRISNTQYTADGSSGANGERTSGGTSWCTKYGCTYFNFQPESGARKTWQVNKCATERTGADAYTDTAPSAAPLGMNYRTTAGGACITQEIQPLTDDKVVLHRLVNSLTASGSTAGHIGLAWGWYLLAPNFRYLWPDSQIADYGKSKMVKAVIFMTDGDFNTPYCQGVVGAGDAPGKSAASSRINCEAPNGTSLEQAAALCRSIKDPQGDGDPKNDVLLYTVAFEMDEVANAAAIDMLRACATTPQHYFQTGGDVTLAQAFAEIAQSLSELRLSK
jgi:Flp pilus assembly protein TadG